MKKAILLIVFAVASGAYFIGSSVMASSQEFNAVEEEAHYNRCGAYVSPAACLAQPQCTWRGSCVPR